MHIQIDLKRLGFDCGDEAINCFWKDLLGFRVKRVGLHRVSLDCNRFVGFWKNLLTGTRWAITYAVKNRES